MKRNVSAYFDWSAEGWLRVAAVTILGTAFCVLIAFAFDSYSFADGTWRWGTDPINNFIIPVLIAPPFFLVLLNQTRRLSIAHNELKEVASKDFLTSLYNRRAFTEFVEQGLKSAKSSRDTQSAALLIIDVDHFKSVNDLFGHEAGDEALVMVSEAVLSAVRGDDIVGRVGGEEFAVFARGLDAEHLEEVAQRIRAAINAAPFSPEGRDYRLSVSIGGAVAQNNSSFSKLYRIADARLYTAKRNGRDRVELGEPGATSLRTVSRGAEHAAAG